MESVGNKKRNHQGVGEGCDGSPVADKRGFFHEDGFDLCVEIALADGIGLSFRGSGGLGIARGAVADDEERGGGGVEVRRGGRGAVEQDLGHGWVTSDGVAVENGLVGSAGDFAGEPHFARDDGLGKVAFADEVGNDIDGGRLDESENLAEARRLFPEAAEDFSEEVLVTDGCGVEGGGGAGVGIGGRSVAGKDECGVFPRRKRVIHGARREGMSESGPMGIRLMANGSAEARSKGPPW